MAVKLDNGRLTRRAALANLAGAVCSSAMAGWHGAAAEDAVGPVFSPSGPNAELYGAAQGYPIPGIEARREGNPYRPEYRVGAFSHIDEIYPTRRIARAATPWTFRRSAAEIRYRFRGAPSSLTEY